jgi:hypothetical protein
LSLCNLLPGQPTLCYGHISLCILIALPSRQQKPLVSLYFIFGDALAIGVRLRPDQEERINAIVERSAILDTSKFVRIAVDWLLRSDIGEVIKKIVDQETFPDYQISKKPPGRKKRRRRPSK